MFGTGFPIAAFESVSNPHPMGFRGSNAGRSSVEPVATPPYARSHTSGIVRNGAGADGRTPRVAARCQTRSPYTRRSTEHGPTRMFTSISVTGLPFGAQASPHTEMSVAGFVYD